MHATAGTIVGLTGLAQIILKKGGKLHRIIGSAYFWSWLVVVITGTVVGSTLIALFGLLGFYMALTGYRFGHKQDVAIDVIDKIVIGGGLAAAIGTLGWGAYLLVKSGSGFGIVALCFGVIFCLTAGQDFREFVLGKPIRRLSGHKMQWYFEHFRRMAISYIAAMTAFAVIQDVFGMFLLNWLLPTAIGAGLIILSTRKYEKQFNI